MNFDLTTFLSSMGGSIVLLFFILKVFLKKKIEAEIQSGYDKSLANLNAENTRQLEGFKLGYQKIIDENQIRFSWYHSEQAKVIKELYKRLATMRGKLAELTAPVKFLPEDSEAHKKFLNEEKQNAAKAYDDCFNYFVINEVLISEGLCKSVRSFLDKCKGIFLDYHHGIVPSSGIGNRHERLEKAEDAAQDLAGLLEELRNSFREMLSGEE